MQWSCIIKALESIELVNKCAQEIIVQQVSIDSRKNCQNGLYIALKGPSFDGHDFIQSAHDNGAIVAIVEKAVPVAIPQLIVANTHQALSQLAKWWRNQFAIPVFAITGSAGKTSVKEMLANIFSQTGKGVVTQGNLNNEIGVPLTLLRIRKDDEYAIIEMGMNHLGEIARLSAIASPQYALITNAGSAHLEGLGSIKNVAMAKAEIFTGLHPNGVAIINQDDDFTRFWLTNTKHVEQLTFGFDGASNVRATFTAHAGYSDINIIAGENQASVCLAVPGEHNVINALAASAMALAADIPLSLIAKGLSTYRPLSGRLQQHHYGKTCLFDDSYNANPLSMKAAINVLSEFDKTALILGDMAELGDVAKAAHQQIGQWANDAKIHTLFTCGQYAKTSIKDFAQQKKSFATKKEMLSYLQHYRTDLSTFDAILVKGSRSAKMENVTQQLQQWLAHAAAEAVC